MKRKQLFLLSLLILLGLVGYGQTNTATITQSGWYRIAINGPLVNGQYGGNRAAARFILRDITSSLHQMVEFLAYVHYGKRPSIVVLNNSHYGGNPPFMKIRIITGGTYEGTAVDVYVHVNSSNHEAYFLQDNDQTSGWSAVDWQQVSTLSGDNDGVPVGFTPYLIELKNMVKGFVGSGGKQVTYTNGNFYTSGNILLGKTTQTNTSYKLDVNGNIRANKVVVNTTGADYVFDSTYYLTPLDSLKNYIQKHNHLPGIPSAEQMKKEGISIGDNQAALLKKMEEMTLYIIKLKKEIVVQKDGLERQQQQLRSQQEQIIKIEQLLKEKQYK